MSRSPIDRLPTGSYGLPGGYPGGDELWTRWTDDDGRARLTLRRSGLVRRADHRAAIRAAIVILRDIPAARGRYTAETGRCAWCGTTEFAARRDWQVGACSYCADVVPAFELAAVAAAARDVMGVGRAA